MTEGGKRASGHQYGLARKWNAETLYRHEEKDDGVTVRFNEPNYRTVHA